MDSGAGPARARWEPRVLVERTPGGRPTCFPPSPAHAIVTWGVASRIAVAVPTEAPDVARADRDALRGPLVPADALPARAVNDLRFPAGCAVILCIVRPLEADAARSPVPAAVR